jgi:ATP-dependent helicase/nuclease subunit A
MSRRSRTARQRFQREAEDEYRRLLYVAMTRAADRLIVCGAEGETRPARLLVRPGARRRFQWLVEEDDGEGKVSGAIARRHQVRSRHAPRPPRTKRKSPSRTGFPSGCGTRRPPKRRARRRCRRPPPSTKRSAAPRPRRLPPPIGKRRCERGRHRAPADAIIARHSAERRKKRCELSRRAPPRISLRIEQDGDRAAHCSPFSMTRTLRRFLRPGSRPEVPIVGRIPRAGAEPLAVAGQVDRLQSPTMPC